MNRVLMTAVCILTCGLLLTGCELVPSVNLTEEQSELVAEYAAGLLMKYDARHINGLMKITDDPIIILSPEPEIKNENKEIDEASVEVSNSVSAAAIEVLPEMAVALGIPDFSVTYQDYEICDIFPETETEKLVFSMQAQEGYQLLILHFDLTNPSDSPMECDVVTNAPLIRLLVNDSERVNMQTTILMNDLGSYKETVDAGATDDTVMVFEISDSVADNLISKLSLLIKTQELDYTYSL